MNLIDRIRAAEQRLEGARAAITPDDQAEIDARAQLAEYEARAQEWEGKRKELDLSRRLDAAMAALPDDAKIKGVSVVGFSDTFIIQYSGSAHAKYQEALHRAQTAELKGKVVEHAAIGRQYAIDVIYDWNGLTGFDTNTELTTKLREFLKNNPGIVGPITNAAGDLAGCFAEERKS